MEGYRDISEILTPRFFRVRPNDYIFRNYKIVLQEGQPHTLGKGFFGITYLVERITDGGKFALKELQSKDSKDLNPLIEEANALLQFKSHPSFVHIEEFFIFNDCGCLVLELCDEDLEKLCKNTTEFFPEK